MVNLFQKLLDFDFADKAFVPALLSPDDLYDRVPALLPSLHEDKRIERKSPGIHAKDLACTVACWSNTSPEGGILVVGIEDNTGRILGCNGIDPKRLNDLEKCGMDHCPEARYSTKRIPATNHQGEPDFLLVFRILYHPTRVVETADHRIFVRRGDSCKELRTDDERQQLRIDKGEVQYEQQPCGLPFPDDFDMPQIRTFAAKVRELRGLSDDTADLKILEIMHLGTRGGDKFIPNIACALLFAKDPQSIIPGCKIRFLRFEGETERTGDKWNAVKDEWIGGSIPFQIGEVAKLIDSQVRRFSVLGKNEKFNARPEYPRDAWLEALVNACVHRSYNYKNMNIFIRMFDDHLDIESPGPFPPGVTPKTIYDVQHSRNPFVMEAMHYLGFVKAANEGVKRIRQTMLELDLPEPIFSQVEVGGTKVSVVLKNDIKLRRLWVDSDVMAMLGAAVAARLSENEKLAVNFLKLHGKINVSDVMRLTGHNWHRSRKLLKRLQEEERILRYVRKEGVSTDRQAYWEIDAKNPPKPAP